MAQLDKTFPTNDCAMCILAPKLVDCGRHPNIELITYADIEEIQGEEGNFKVTITKRPRFVDIEKCTGCGLCTEKCPVKIPDKFNVELNTTKVAYLPFPQAVPHVALIEKEKCLYFTKGVCRLCEKVCGTKAINFEQKEEKIGINVGSVIFAVGYEWFNPKIKGEYGYNRYQNVITSIEFERIMCAGGPTGGKITRLSDNKPPKKVAFIQCVGSRDEKVGHTYCSSVCCMYAIKECIIAKEIDPNIEFSIFFMDMRAYGKGFEEYYKRGEEEGIKYIRSKISEIEETNDNNLLIKYETEDGVLKKEEFGLVVLSLGLKPIREITEFAQKFGIKLNQHKFAETFTFSPLESTRKGIFVSGVLQAPKDIPDTVAQSSGAASLASSLISSERGRLVTIKEYPPEREISDKEPQRIGVFVCHCGINIAGVVDVKKVEEEAKKLENVVYVERNLYSCSPDTQVIIAKKIKEHNLNRVVVAACTPRTHEPLFRDTCREAGLNPYLFEMANIRDQCSWVHMHEPLEATKKAIDLVRMAVAKSRNLVPLKKTPQEVNKRAIVIGGGITGMTAAINIAEGGFEVYLIEKEEELGGNVRNIYYLLDDEDPQVRLKDIIEKVRKNDKITVLTGTEIKNIKGYVGNFSVEVNGDKEIKGGVIVVATGAYEYKPDEYFYGKDTRVVTQLELEKLIFQSSPKLKQLKTVVMIQCVGSRNEERSYCSRVCCSEAIKNAILLKNKYPNSNIYILYKDIRSYGFREDNYQRAREEGVIFIRYDDTHKPEVTQKDGKLKVLCFDPIIGEQLAVDTDLLVLSTATIPNDTGSLPQLLKVPRTEHGFFLEAHMKLRPIDFAVDGIFLCGTAHSPKFIDESISQACGVAGRAATILSKDIIEAEGVVANVTESICRGCGDCVETCEFNAIELVEKEVPGVEGWAPLVAKVAQVNPIACKGCGSCSAVCPTGAMIAQHFTREQIESMVSAVAST
jgi:heterodisulfide reductase subunit A